MDVTQIPVKESCTSSKSARSLLVPEPVSVYIRDSREQLKPFMSKRLNKKHRPATPAPDRRKVRLERPRLNRYQAFLKRLRAGGRSNMYGAIPYLMDAFALDRGEAFRIVCEWVDEQRAEESATRGEVSAERQPGVPGRLPRRTA